MHGRRHAKAERYRKEMGIRSPESWREDPFTVLFGTLLVGAAAAAVIVGVAGPLTQAVFERPEDALAVGILVVVLLGGAGLVVRGLGERRSSPKLKEYGYYCGALAYLATASVALFTVAPDLAFGP